MIFIVKLSDWCTRSIVVRNAERMNHDSAKIWVRYRYHQVHTATWPPMYPPQNWQFWHYHYCLEVKGWTVYFKNMWRVKIEMGKNENCYVSIFRILSWVVTADLLLNDNLLEWFFTCGQNKSKEFYEHEPLCKELFFLFFSLISNKKCLVSHKFQTIVKISVVFSSHVIFQPLTNYITLIFDAISYESNFELTSLL